VRTGACRSTVIAARDFLASQGIENDDLLACELALVEACNNAIRYAAETRRKLPIEIHLFVENSRLEMHVVDHTNGFDLPQKIELPARSERMAADCSSYNPSPIRFHICAALKKIGLYCANSKGASDGALGAKSPGAPAETCLERGSDWDDGQGALFSFGGIGGNFRCTSEMGKTTAVEELSYRLLADLLQIVGADWFILRFGPEGRTVASRVHQEFTAGFDARIRFGSTEAGARPRIPLTGQRGLASFSRAIHRLAAAQNCRRRFRARTFSLARSIPSQRMTAGRKLPRSVGLVQPIVRGETLLGTLAIGRFEVEKPFTVDQVEVIYTFCEFLAIQLVNARLQKEQVELRLTAHELEIARNIQQSLLPKTFPVLPGFWFIRFLLERATGWRRFL